MDSHCHGVSSAHLGEPRKLSHTLRLLRLREARQIRRHGTRRIEGEREKDKRVETKCLKLWRGRGDSMRFSNFPDVNAVVVVL